MFKYPLVGVESTKGFVVFQNEYLVHRGLMCICIRLSSRICRTASYMGRFSTPAIFSASTIIVFSINCKYSVSLMVMYFVDSDFIFAIFLLLKKSFSGLHSREKPVN